MGWQKNILSFLFLILCLTTVFTSGCGGTANRELKILLINYPDLAPLPYSPTVYDNAFFGMTDGPQRTPGGHPVFGSIKQWFETQSNGLFTIHGTVYGPFTATQTWAVTQRNQGELWTTATRRQALALARQAGHSIGDNDDIAIVHNIRGQRDIQNHHVVYLKGLRNGSSNDIESLGNITHELGHLFLRQPDRYTFTWGGLRTWDNMADNYDDFPAGYSAAGRVLAGWATWGAITDRGDFTLRIPPLPTQAIIPRYRSRIDQPTDIDKQSFFTLEYRKSSAEGGAVLPAEGVMLLENDPQQNLLIGQRRNLSTEVLSCSNAQTNAQNSPNTSESTVTFVHRSLGDYVRGQEHLATWAASYGHYNCLMGTSLNILGECLWDFLNIHTDDHTSTVTGTLNTDIVLDAHWRPTSPALRTDRASSRSFAIPAVEVFNLFTEPLRSGRRLYFKATAPLTVWLEDAQHRTQGRTEFTRPTQGPNELSYKVMDLDPLFGGGRVYFSGEGAGSVTDVMITERTRSSGQPRLQFAPQFLRTGSTWGTYVEKIRSNSTISLNIEPGNVTNQLLRNASVMRLVLAYANDRGPIPTNDNLREELEISVCPVSNNIPFYAGCQSRFIGGIAASRREPFVLLLPFDMGQGDSAQVQVYRGPASCQADLVVLAADYLPLF